MIRDVGFADIPQIRAIVQRAYMRSLYAKLPGCEIDPKALNAMLMTGIQRHGGTNGGATWMQVGVRADGSVSAFILAALSRVYGIGTMLMATDLFFLAEEGVEANDPYRLAKGMVEWATGNDKVAEIRCGTTGAVLDDTASVGVIWRRLGLEHFGEIWSTKCRG